MSIRSLSKRGTIEAYSQIEDDYYNSLVRQQKLRQVIKTAKRYTGMDRPIEEGLLFDEMLTTSISRMQLRTIEKLKGVRAGDINGECVVGDVDNFSKDSLLTARDKTYAAKKGDFMLCVSSLLTATDNKGEEVVLKPPVYVLLDSYSDLEHAPTLIYDAKAHKPEFLEAVEKMRDARISNQLTKAGK